MRVNVDYGLRVVVDTESMPWQTSPLPGVWRKLLESDCGEITRCTTLVRFDPDVRPFSHRQDAGEEIFVVEGVLEDEHGRYPAGTWLRGPHMSAHTPSSRAGCLIYVRTGMFVSLQ